MNRYEILKDIFFQTIEEKSHGLYKKEAYFHSLQVLAICKDFAIKRGLDIELSSIIGLFHDYSTYIHQTSFDHALRSSQMVADLLIKTQLFDDQEMNIIINAIKNHSDKDKLHDNYSELIKDADVYAQYLEEPNKQLNQSYQDRRRGCNE